MFYTRGINTHVINQFLKDIRFFKTKLSLCLYIVYTNHLFLTGPSNRWVIIIKIQGLCIHIYILLEVLPVDGIRVYQ